MSYENNFNVVTLANITLEPYFSKYMKEFFAPNQIDPTMYFISHNEYMNESNSSILNRADLVIVWLNIEYLYPDLFNEIILKPEREERVLQELNNIIADLFDFVKKNSRAPLVWIGAEDYCYHKYTYCLGYSISSRLIDSINSLLKSMLVRNDKYLDLKTVIAKVGIDSAFDSKNKYRWNNPYTKELWNVVVEEIHKQYLISNGITKKCVVLDCDNVLWGGVLSEDGVEKIQLGSSGCGRSFQDFQRYILTLYNYGVIVTICSKNDISDVLCVFREHSEMILKEEHVACFCVNWDNKSDNIRRISETLNIGLDSMVFIDDSDFEIALVKSTLPDVTVVKYTKDTVYGQLSCFNLKNDIDIDVIHQRNHIYQTNHARKALELEALSFDAFLQSLELSIDIHEASPIEYARISELTQRTNKFTNGRRLSIEQIEDRMENGYRLFAVLMSDKFSNFGLIGAIGVFDNMLDLFSLSCRALGRNVEHKMLDFIKDRNTIHNVYFNLTLKNHELYEKISSFFGDDIKIIDC